METTERIVEAYCRHIRHWFTIPNIRVKNSEVDLIAVDKDGNKAHIEISVSISGGFSKLTKDPYTPGEEKQRTKQAKARTKLGYFEHKKFGSPAVLDVLRKRYGFASGSYQKIIVTWDAEPEAQRTAREKGIEVWLLPEIIEEIKQHFGRQRGYHRDDTIRTLHLVARAEASRSGATHHASGSETMRRRASSENVSLEDWKRFVSSLPGHVGEVEYSLAQMGKRLGHDLTALKSPTEYNQFWQSKHPHSELWRKAGWTAKPRRDPESGKIVAVRFIRIAR